jgi:LysM repeat protein
MRTGTTHRRRHGWVVTLLLPLLLVAVGTTGTATAPPAAAAPAVHVVRPDDTMVTVARRYGIARTHLAAWNGIAVDEALQPDALLRLSPPLAPVPRFTSSVSTVTAAQLGSSYRAGCPVGPSSLRSVKVLRWTFNGTAGTGQLIVHQDVAAQTVRAFRTLYEQRVPVQRIQPVTAYGSSDAASMEANNTSAFNCRLATGSTTRWSQHSYGRAIDVNPVQNPYIRGGTVLPSAGAAYTDRTRYKVGMLHRVGGVRAFKAQGFYWGGDWSSPKDYQHFSTTNR